MISLKNYITVIATSSLSMIYVIVKNLTVRI